MRRASITYSKSEVVCERALFVSIVRCVGFAYIKLHKVKRSMAVETQREATLWWLCDHMAVFLLLVSPAALLSSGPGTFAFGAAWWISEGSRKLRKLKGISTPV